MNRKFRIIGLLLAVMLILTVQSAIAQEQGSFFFPETGHYVTGNFYSFYFANPNAQLVYGFPVTEAFTDTETGRRVQYFEKVRFEYFVENNPGDKVRLTPLGQLLYEHGTYIDDLSANTPNCYQQDRWDYPVCSSFHSFYENNGGEAQFGKPVSGLEMLRGQLVQFFEYAQLVWMPANIPAAQIVVAQLGLKYFYVQGLDPKLLEPDTSFGYNGEISKINVTAFPKNAVISNGEVQVVNLIAVDQNGHELPKGIVYVTLRYPDGKKTQINSLTTDELGLASFAFTANASELGPVEVIVRLTYNDLEAITVTSFRLWY